MVKYVPSNPNLLEVLLEDVRNILDGPISSEDIKVLIYHDDMEILHDYVGNDPLKNNDKLKPTAPSLPDELPSLDDEEEEGLPLMEDKSVRFAPPEDESIEQVNALFTMH